MIKAFEGRYEGFSQWELNRATQMAKWLIEKGKPLMTAYCIAGKKCNIHYSIIRKDYQRFKPKKLKLL